MISFFRTTAAMYLSCFNKNFNCYTLRTFKFRFLYFKQLFNQVIRVKLYKAITHIRNYRTAFIGISLQKSLYQCFHRNRPLHTTVPLKQRHQVLIFLPPLPVHLSNCPRLDRIFLLPLRGETH